MSKAKVIAEGGIFLGLFLALLVTTLYVPFVSLLPGLFLPIPIMMYTSKHGLWKGVAFAIAGTVLSAIFGQILGLLLAISALVPGVILAEGIRRQWGFFLIIVSGGMAAFLTLMANYYGSIWLLQSDFIKESFQALDESMKLVQTFAGDNPAVKQQLAAFKVVKELMLNLIPMMFVLMSFCTAWLYLAIARLTYRKLKMPFITFPKMKDFTLPIWWGIVTLAVLLLHLMKLEPNSIGDIVRLNLSFVVLFSIVAQGMAVYYWFAHRQSWPRAMTHIALVVMLVFGIGFNLFLILGIIEVGFKIRDRFQTV